MVNVEGEEIIHAYAKFCKLRENISNNLIDLGNQHFLYPTTIVPLMVLVDEKNLSFSGNIDSNLKSYLQTVTGQVAGQHFKSSKSYLCIQQFPQDENEIDFIFKNIYSVLTNDCSKSVDQALRWILSELSDNVYQHSRFDNAYLMVQRFSKKKYVEIVILDNGRSVYGSYINNGFNIKDGLDALKYALSGVSTKKDRERGTGLPSSIDLTIKGYKGAVSIISANGIAYLDQNKKKFYKLEKQQEYKGTIITIRLPYPLQNLKTEDFYEIIEPK